MLFKWKWRMYDSTWLVRFHWSIEKRWWKMRTLNRLLTRSVGYELLLDFGFVRFLKYLIIFVEIIFSFLIVLIVVDLHNRFKVISEFEVESLSIFPDAGLSIFETDHIVRFWFLEELDKFNLGLRWFISVESNHSNNFFNHNFFSLLCCLMFELYLKLCGIVLAEIWIQPYPNLPIFWDCNLIFRNWKSSNSIKQFTISIQHGIQAI